MANQVKTYEDEFRAIFAAKCAYNGLNTRAKQEKALGIDEWTLRRKLKDPAQFLNRELRVIYAVLGFGLEERDLLNHSGRMKEQKRA